MSRCRRNSPSCVERILVRNPLVQWTGQKAINHNLISVFVGFGDISTDCQPATRQHYGLYITHHHHLVWFCAREAVACCSPAHPNCFRVSSCCLTAVVVWCSAAPIIIITWCFDFCVGKQFVIVVLLMRHERQQIIAPGIFSPMMIIIKYIWIFFKGEEEVKMNF